MITKQEVIDNYKEYETFADDRFGKRFANYCYADELEKIGFGLNCSEEEWNKDVKDFTRENIIKEMVEDAEFGYEKSMDDRGISASLMSSVCESWVKILEDEDLIGLEMNTLFVNIIEKYGGRKAYKLMTEEELIIELEDLSDENERLKKENEEIGISIKLFEDDVKRFQEENEQLQEKLKDANDEVDYWKDIVERYRSSAQLDIEECTIIQGNKKYVGKVKCFVKYENHSSIELYDLKEVKVIEDEE